MNALFFLTPKSDVTYIYSDFTLGDTISVIEKHKFAAIPVLNRDGTFSGIITEGDILWHVKSNVQGSIDSAYNIPISDIKRRFTRPPINADTSIEDLVFSAMNQNFVPVVDDRGFFIGIVTRKEIIKYLYEKKNA